jgi:subtilase family serine protease
MMDRRIRTRGLVAALLGAAVVGSALMASPGSSGGRQVTASLTPGVVSRLAGVSGPLTTAQCESLFQLACYGVAQIQTAYDVAPLFRRGVTGRGQTIAIIDAFGSPTIASDLAQFDADYGLPAPPSLTIVQPAGKVQPFDGTNPTMVAWAGETTLDVEWAHAMAPGASLLLLETPVAQTEGLNGLAQIDQAANYAINNHRAQVISESFNANEATLGGQHALAPVQTAIPNAASHGVTIVAATGDNGATSATNTAGTTLSTRQVINWPASDPLVTAVGGTELHLDANGVRTSPDTVWNDGGNSHLDQLFFGNPGPEALASGGGKSTIYPRPKFQDPETRVVGRARGIPDVAMSAGCNGAVIVYESYPGIQPGWYITCGTSESAPLFAGIVALAAQEAGHGLGAINPALYSLRHKRNSGIRDVTTGNNTVSFHQSGVLVTVHGFTAASGYDLASGLGTVDAAQFVPQLAQAASKHTRDQGQNQSQNQNRN